MAYQVIWPNLNVGTNEDGTAKVAKRGDVLQDDEFPLDVSSLVVVGAIQPVEEAPKKVQAESSSTKSTATSGKTFTK